MKDQEAIVRTIKSAKLNEFDKECQRLVNDGWQPDSDLQVTPFQDGFVYHRTYIWIPVATGEERDLT